jgi:2Fe-2S ferredoxin
VEPSGIELDARPGETVIECAWRHGYYWPTLCGGKGACRTCYLVVEGSDKGLAPPSRSEQQSIQAHALPQGDRQVVRLACQARVFGDVVVTKHGVYPAGDQR